MLDNIPEKTLKRIVQGLTAVVVVGGLGLALAALLAPAGVWFGLWNFQGGFALLGTVHPVALWAAILGAVITIALFVLAQRTGSFRPGVFSLVATVAVALAWFIPESYRPGENVPPIHDISTDTQNPPQYVDVPELRGPGTNSLDYGAGENLTPQRLASLQQEAYPDIEPQIFDAPPDEVFDRALETARDMGWEIVASAPEEGRIEATDTTFWFRFKDDIVIRISETAEGDTRLDARSHSRVGRSDVGKNAARLNSFFANLREGG